MLFALYANPSLVRLTEYIPHILVCASSPRKAREMAAKTYPKHPFNLMESPTEAAQLGYLRVLEPLPGEGQAPVLYFCDQGHTDLEIRGLAVQLCPEVDPHIWLFDSSSKFRTLSLKGRAGVLARVQNLTPAIVQKGEDKVVFCWKEVDAAWPNSNVSANKADSAVAPDADASTPQTTPNPDEMRGQSESTEPGTKELSGVDAIDGESLAFDAETANKVPSEFVDMSDGNGWQDLDFERDLGLSREELERELQKAAQSAVHTEPTGASKP